MQNPLFRAALLTSLVLLAGCATRPLPPGPYHIPRDALQRRVNFDQVCVLENPAVKTDILIEAIQDGIAAVGAHYVPLPAGAGPQVCSYTITYEVEFEGKHLKSVTFHTFENGIPIYSARGTASATTGITFDMVSQYVQLVIARSRQGRSRVPAPAPESAPQSSAPAHSVPVKAVAAERE